MVPSFQHILNDFVSVELLYHARSLEMYTQCFNDVQSLSENDDLEVGNSVPGWGVGGWGGGGEVVVGI